ncbi:polysaccharide pyruvyl transferase family protein [Algoriphagus sp. SE2]|uniref:polysaccharide pyruvyl transferase family protein n=1 Tax=Algoriphagus sp. SE2 TaxID=3141536 RepID=UPI0031CD9738
MVIELRGVEFVNKGAELMLRAILSELKVRIPGVQFAMDVGSRTPREKLNESGILQKTTIYKFGINLSPWLSVLPKTILRSYKLVAEKEIDAILDASGFAFGDKWGSKKAGDRSANHIKDWKEAGKKVIFLPQAFGPFTDPLLINKMQTILTYADLIFARDVKSLEYLKKLKAPQESINLAPDFTNLLSGKEVPNQQAFNSKIAIIPNQKMMETEDELKNKQYPAYLKLLITLLQEKGEEPFFLIHESRKDGQIADLVNDNLTKKIEVIKEENPLKVKGIIGSSKAVVTSRFHGLVSALSQSIPSLSTGWSHKYRELLRDYDYEDALCEVSVDSEYLNSKIETLLDDTIRRQGINRLKQNANIQKERSKEMWDKVISHLLKK